MKLMFGVVHVLERFLWYILPTLFLLTPHRVSADAHRNANDPRCCGPDQWEAVSFQTEGYVDSALDYVTFTEVDNTVHYDYKNKRLALEQNIWNSTRNGTYDQRVIIDFNKRLKWTLTDRQCRQEVYTLPMTSPCIPGEAKFLKRRTINEIKAEVWQWNDTIGGSTWTYTVTSDTCIQLIQTRLNHKASTSFNTTFPNYVPLIASLKR